MTVEQLLQKLVELARGGKGQWIVTRADSDWDWVPLEGRIKLSSETSHLPEDYEAIELQ